MKKKGFTLIELLVVIAIIGILATIVVVVTRGARDDARERRVEAQLAQIRALAELHFNANDWSYEGMFDDPAPTEHAGQVQLLIEDIDDITNRTAIHETETEQYCVSVQLIAGGADAPQVCISDAVAVTRGMQCNLVEVECEDEP